MFRACTKIMLGNGAKTQFCHDHWLHVFSLKMALHSSAQEKANRRSISVKDEAPVSGSHFAAGASEDLVH